MAVHGASPASGRSSGCAIRPVVIASGAGAATQPGSELVNWIGVASAGAGMMALWRMNASSTAMSSSANAWVMLGSKSMPMGGGFGPSGSQMCSIGGSRGDGG